MLPTNLWGVFFFFPVGDSQESSLIPQFKNQGSARIKLVMNFVFALEAPASFPKDSFFNQCHLKSASHTHTKATYRKQTSACQRERWGVWKNKLGLKVSISNQVSSSEGGSFLLKPGTTPLPPGGATSPSKSTNGAPGTVSESEEEKAKKLLYCSLCKVAVNSLSQLEAHNTGSKHKTMVEARNGAGPIKSYPRPGSRLKMQNGSKGSGLQNKTFHCEICDVHVNSEIQLKQHISSRRHKDRVAGKPLKPKYSPYNKLQRSPSILAAKLAFQKDMMKPLAPAFLSSPLAAAAVSSALSLPPRPSASLFQAAAIPPALLRPGHGPIRATPASILFAPY
ncbi:hypothetical protein FD755_008497 [Muntiacus reevesi]|uniref:C2H2-type domain-containing protein n=1 Tax=Muntiacus reevesi TaxID=9886 RepID=A0A5J5MKF7_MUNRE|nr:hypothetical protein FD755_008497 [Muntiacus reevesi]